MLYHLVTQILSYESLLYVILVSFLEQILFNYRSLHEKVSPTVKEICSYLPRNLYTAFSILALYAPLNVLQISFFT